MKASGLKINATVKVKGKLYTVISNHIGDTLFLVNKSSSTYDGFHLFYDCQDDIEYAKTIGIDLSLGD